MPSHTALVRATILAVALAGAALAATPPVQHHIVQIHLAATAPHALAGRLLLFAEPLPKGKPPTDIDADEFEPQAVTTAAQDIPNLAPGETVDIDADTIAYPAGFSKLQDGAYLLQAVLDVRHMYAYDGRGEGDVTSNVVPFSITSGAADIPAIELSHTIPATDPWAQPARVPAAIRAAVLASRAHAEPINFPSPALTKFWGRPITLRGWVLPPPGYDAQAATTYPTVYYTHGFGGSYAGVLRPLAYIDAAMRDKNSPP